MNNACRGSIYDKEPDEVYAIFKKLSQNSRHKSSRRKKGIYTVDANTENSIQMTLVLKKLDTLTNDMGQVKQRMFMGDKQAGGPGSNEVEKA